MTREQVFTPTLNALNQAHIGGKTLVAQITGAQIGVQAAAYASGDVLGTLNPIEVEVFTFNNGTGILQSCIVGDLAKQDGIIDILIFNDNPTATTFTDNSALTVNAADVPKIIDVISIVAADYKDFATNSVAVKSAIGVPIKNVSLTIGKLNKIWVAFVSRDTKTYTANCISANLGILQD